MFRLEKVFQNDDSGYILFSNFIKSLLLLVTTYIFVILSDYFNDFFNFCFDIDNDNMIEGRINFNYNQNGCT